MLPKGKRWIYCRYGGAIWAALRQAGWTEWETTGGWAVMFKP